MIEHPVPQNITSYEFRLVGSMTLKQFFELMIGLGLAYMVYTTNLYPLIKWPLVFLLGIFGVALAFVPIEERPLDQWFWAFIRAIYNPTKFYWRRTLKEPEVFSNDTTKLTRYKEDEDSLALAVSRKRSRAEAYLQSLSTPTQEMSVDVSEANRAAGILSLFDEVRVPLQSIEVTPQRFSPESEKPDLKLAPRRLHHANLQVEFEETNKSQLEDEKSTSLVQRKDGPVEVVAPPAVAVPIFSQQSTEPSLPQEIPQSYAVRDQREVSLPQALPSQEVVSGLEPDAHEVVTSRALPFPNPPKAPNVLAGMVLDASGKLLENTIIEIRTEQGVPVRAIKSNKLGQFFTSSPLPTGIYQVFVEKPGYTFEPKKLSVNDTVIAPLEIQAKPTLQ